MNNNVFVPLPRRKDVMVNSVGHPAEVGLPECVEVEGKYINTLYRPDDITSDWVAYKQFLKKIKPDFVPKVILVGHDKSEIENITLMALGGVVCHMNGVVNYALLGEQNIHYLDKIIEEKKTEWVGFNIYTGFEDYVFEWIKQYKIHCAEKIFNKKQISFDEADYRIKKLLMHHRGPVYKEGVLVYAPIIIGGHYNTFSYAASFEQGADYVVRGKGVNLLRDILLNLYAPGIYHDPMPYANIPLMDREGFYEDTFSFSNETKKFAMSPIKSVLTALGCSYSCTYCYIGSLIDDLNEVYKDTGLRTPSIIQDRPIETVIGEGEEIVRLDKKYGVKTKAVFDQADISLNNISWWKDLSKHWMNKVGIKFYIQARPAMLAGKAGIKRLSVLDKSNLISGVSMAIESGDAYVRKLLLDRHENNVTILSAIKNIKSFSIPVRTQAIVGLPVVKPRIAVNQKQTSISLVDKEGFEHYYEDALQESIKCLELVCSSSFGLIDYYWNAVYSPFPGTPLGDYTQAAGFASEHTVKEAFLFSSESKLNCFTDLDAKRQIAFTYTSNFFAHMKNGADMMALWVYRNESFGLDVFAEFVHSNNRYFDSNAQDKEYIKTFIDYAYGDDDCAEFKVINTKLLSYYSSLMDGVVLAAKVASKYFRNRSNGMNAFDLYDLYRVERSHYYDNSYSMNYVPIEYSEFFKNNFNIAF